MSPAKISQIPTGIAIPDEVRTRYGTLRFFDGMPDEATTKTLFDNLDFQRASQAYQLGLAPVAIAAMRDALLEWGPANGTLVIWEDLVYPRFIGPVYNTSTSYSYAWLDLHDGPVVVEVPAKVYGFVNDSWCRWVVDVGITGPDQGHGGRYLFVPPDHTGEVPDGFLVVRSRTYGVWVGWRGFRDEHGDPHPAVEMIKAHTRIHLLSQAADPPPTRFVNASPLPMCAIAPADDRFWEMLREVVQSEPPESADPLTLGMFAAIGIQRGMPFNPDERMRAILSEAATIGDATARAVTYRFRAPEAYCYPDSAWRLGILGGYSCTENGVLLLDSATALYFLAAATSPSWDQKMVGTGSQYAVANLDATGAPFDGARNYRLHVRPNVPAANFWSILVYDTQTRSMLQTDQQWPSVTSQDPDLTTNEDGSVDINFGPEPPTDGGNWVQTLPGKGWFAMFRLYAPLEPWFDKTWRLSEIERAE